MPRDPEYQVVDWSPEYGDAFDRLNREWLEKYFRVEPIDEVVLGDPETTILNAGGVILYVLDADEPVGTVALKHQGEGVFELTKMAVTEASQGRGLGRLLMCAAVERFEAIEGQSMYLESHSSLGAALALYESAGFHHEPPPAPSDYERADVYMVYRPESSENSK